jgi:hypothetical protein
MRDHPAEAISRLADEVDATSSFSGRAVASVSRGGYWEAFLAAFSTEHIVPSRWFGSDARCAVATSAARR